MPSNSRVNEPSSLDLTIRESLINPIAITRIIAALQIQSFPSINQNWTIDQVSKAGDWFNDLWGCIVRIAIEPKLAQRRWLYFLRTLLHPNASVAYFHLIERTPTLKALVEKYPSWLLKTQRPYLSKSLSASKTVDLIDQHYTWLGSLLPKNVAEQIIFTLNTTIARIETRNGAHYKLTLSPAETFEREGELLLRLWHEESCGDVLVGIIAFSIITSSDARPNLLIGCVQGPRPEHGPVLMKQATRNFHGRRPLHFLLGALLSISRVWGAEVLGIRKHQHVLQHWSRLRRKFTFDYDRFWKEADGRLDRRGIYQLPSCLPRRAISEVPSSKRSEYRRRYALEENVDLQVNKVLRGVHL